MKAILNISDVCGLRNNHKFEISSGKLSYIKGNNASGKSSIIKALTAVLSMPKEGAFIKNENEAYNLGIKSEELSAHDNFVNIYGERATVNLSYNNVTNKYVVKSSGEILSTPNGNENFLLIGTVANNSRVIQQLRSGNNESEFGWLIDGMSLAKNYELMRALIRDKIDETSNKKRVIEDKLKAASKFTDELNSFQKELVDLEKVRENIMKDFNKDDAQKRKELYNFISTIRYEVDELRSDLTRQKGVIDNKKEKVDKTKNEMKKIVKKIEGLKKSTLIENFEEYRKQATKEKNILVEEKSKIDGLLNIYQSAHHKMLSEQIESVECFLCENGELNKGNIEVRISNIIQEKKSIETKIYEINTNLFDFEKKIVKQKEELKRLKDKKKDYEGYVFDSERDLKRAKDTYDGVKELYNEKSEKLSILNEKYAKLIDKNQDELSKQLNEVETNIRSIEDRQAILKNKVVELTGNEDIMGKDYSSKEALDVYNTWLKYLNSASDYCDYKYTKFREEARNQFNKNIIQLMNEIGFKGFKSIWINEDGRLMVERDSEEEMPQPVGSLSISEKYAIGILLQLSVKEAYLPQIPFFIVDDVLQDFDDSKKVIIEQYLNNLAKEKDMFVLISMLDNDIETVRIE